VLALSPCRPTIERQLASSQWAPLDFDDLKEAVEALSLHSEEDSDGTEKPHKKYYVLEVEYRTEQCADALHMLDNIVVPLKKDGTEKNCGHHQFRRRLYQNPPSWNMLGSRREPRFLAPCYGNELSQRSRLSEWAVDMDKLRTNVRRNPDAADWSPKDAIRNGGGGLKQMVEDTTPEDDDGVMSIEENSLNEEGGKEDGDEFDGDREQVRCVATTVCRSRVDAVNDVTSPILSIALLLCACANFFVDDIVAAAVPSVGSDGGGGGGRIVIAHVVVAIQRRFRCHIQG
jgi:hypothetical protein